MMLARGFCCFLPKEHCWLAVLHSIVEVGVGSTDWLGLRNLVGSHAQSGLESDGSGPCTFWSRDHGTCENRSTWSGLGFAGIRSQRR